MQKEPREVIEAFKGGDVLRELPVLSGPLNDTRDWDLVPNLGPTEVRLKQLTQPDEPTTPVQVYKVAQAVRRLQSLWNGQAEQVAETIGDGECFLADLVDTLYQQIQRRTSTAEESSAISLEPYASGE